LSRQDFLTQVMDFQ